MTLDTQVLQPDIAVVIDSSRSEYLTAKATVLPALRFWGFPFKTIDLASVEDIRAPLGASGAVVIAQEYLGEQLAPHMDTLLERVQVGGALVNLDHTLFDYDPRQLRRLGLTGIGREASVDALVIPDSSHTVLRNVLPGVGPRLRFPLPATPVAAPHGEILLQGPEAEPLVVAGTLGSGRFVQWALSPKVWHRGYLGLAHGIDSLLWRGILWAAPKPFAVNSLRPYVRYRFDDCNGHWQDPSDLAFVDELVERGFAPSICFCLKALTAEGSRHLARLQKQGKVDLAPHTYKPGTSFFHGDTDGEYTTERFAEMFAELDRARDEWGVTWSTILSDHEHEWSRRAVPFLRERGIRHKMNILLTNERWSDPHVDWHPAPYGSMSYALDYLPGDLSDFFAVFNHHPSFDSARVYSGTDAGTFLYHRPGGFGSQKWDFLNGLVRGEDDKDFDAAVARLVEHTQIGLDAQFFGGSITHSHFTRFLRPGEMAAMLDATAERLASIEQIPTSYDEVADYAEAHANTTVASSEIRDGHLSTRLTGRSWRQLALSVYTERDGALVREETVIPAFENEVTVTTPV